MNISLFNAKRRLVALWFVLSAVIFGLIVFHTISGGFEGKSNEVWEWLLPNIAPALLLILVFFLYDLDSDSNCNPRLAPRFLYMLAFGLSLAYLLAVLIVILLQPISHFSGMTLMRGSNLLLGPFQGLVCAAVGLLFMQRN
jgi:hypothetical protein